MIRYYIFPIFLSCAVSFASVHCSVQLVLIRRSCMYVRVFELGTLFVQDDVLLFEALARELWLRLPCLYYCLV